VSHAYLSALEGRLAWHESFVKALKSASPKERDRLLGGVDLDDHLGLPAPDDAGKDAGKDLPSTPSSYTTGSLHSGPSGDSLSLPFFVPWVPPSQALMCKGALQYHGPTSIYLGEDFDVAAPASRSVKSATSVHAWSNLRLAAAMGIDGALVEATLSLFFSRQYPQFMFVYREAFLADYFDHEHGGKYWSFPLLYAVCALGAPHSQDPTVRAKKHLLAKCAEEMILTHELNEPTYTTVQALLCLAFHELGQASSSKGWLLSGKIPPSCP
jgi:hypothetical protein